MKYNYYKFSENILVERNPILVPKNLHRRKITYSEFGPNIV